MGSQYFVSRQQPQLSGKYWGPVTDPDGRKRDMASRAENAIAINDAIEEIAWLDPEGDTGPVIDLGCGTGACLSAFTPHRKLIGVEPDHDAQAAARALLPDVALFSYVLHVPARVQATSLLCYHAIEHMTDPFATLWQALECCAPGARVVVSTPDFNSPSAQQYGDRFRLLHDQTHISMFSTDSLIRMMIALNLEIFRVSHPFAGTRWEAEAREWADTDDNWSPPAPGNIVSVYAGKR